VFDDVASTIHQSLVLGVAEEGLPDWWLQHRPGGRGTELKPVPYLTCVNTREVSADMLETLNELILSGQDLTTVMVGTGEVGIIRIHHNLHLYHPHPTEPRAAAP